MANLYHNEYWECPAVARMQAWIRLRHWSVPSSITLCSTPNHASIRFCLKSSTSWAFSGRLAAPYFEINVLRSGLFSGQKSGSSYKSLTLLHFWTGAANDGQNVRADTACGKDNDQNILKIIIWYRSVYNQTASDAWRYNNPVYKLTTDKLQLMLIDVRLDLNIKVSQGSVATRLMCDGNFNDQFITQSVLSQTVKRILKIGQNLPKLWTIKYRVVLLMKHGV